MLLLIRNNKIIGTANDDYTGEEQTIPAPVDFDITKIDFYEVVGGVAVLSLAKQIDAICLEKSLAGFPVTFGPLTGHTLQTREQDKPNWLSVLGAAGAMIVNGTGDSTLSPGIRTMDNSTIAVTAFEAQAAMLGMQAYLGAILSHAWALKDAVAAGTPVDITAGWPV